MRKFEDDKYFNLITRYKSYNKNSYEEEKGFVHYNFYKFDNERIVRIEVSTKKMIDFLEGVKSDEEIIRVFHYEEVESDYKIHYSEEVEVYDFVQASKLNKNDEIFIEIRDFIIENEKMKLKLLLKNISY